MAMDISQINSQLSGFINSSAKDIAKQDSFKNALEKAMEEKDEKELKKACQEFEGYYLQQLFKEMRRTVPEGTLLEKSQGREIFEDMLYEEYAKDIAQGKGVGLSDLLYKQLSKNK